MGFILEQKDSFGEWNGEVRRESVLLIAPDNWDEEEEKYVERPDGMYVYPRGKCRQGAAEFLIKDIPKVMAVLEAMAEHSLKKGY